MKLSHTRGPTTLEPAYDAGTRTFSFAATQRIAKKSTLRASYDQKGKQTSVEWSRQGSDEGGPIKVRRKLGLLHPCLELLPVAAQGASTRCAHRLIGRRGRGSILDDAAAVVRPHPGRVCLQAPMRRGCKLRLCGVSGCPTRAPSRLRCNS